MSFWNSERFLAEGEKIIDYFDRDRVTASAYELSVGQEYYATSMEAGKEVVDKEQIRIPPGQLALLITKETIHMPASNIGFISIKFKYKKRGLINVSGFHVDPGFSGRLQFSVYNAGSNTIYFDAEQRLFPLWISDLVGLPGTSDATDERTFDKTHEHFKQKEITAQDVTDFQGEVASPAELKSQIDSLSTKVGYLWAAVLIAIGALIGPHMVYWINYYTNQANRAPAVGRENPAKPDAKGTTNVER